LEEAVPRPFAFTSQFRAVNHSTAASAWWVVASLVAAIFVVGADANAARRRRPPAQVAVTPTVWPTPAPLKIVRFTLANGLRVVVQPDPSAPLV
jgi:hypothetical protein